VFGVFGATASAAKLRGLDAAGMRASFGVAGAEAAGLRENFGTMTKPFQAGHAAEGGVKAVELVAVGWTAAQNIFEAKRGFFNAYGWGFDAGAIAGKFGKPWTFLTPGISIKPYPSGSLTHPAMDELIGLIRKNRIKAQDVASVRVGTNKQMLNTLIHHEPKNGLQAKFSMEYCMAVIVVEGKAGLAQFEDASVARPEVQELLRRVDFYNNPKADAAGANLMRSYIDIKLRNNSVVSGYADFAKGSPQKPMTYEEAADKFRGCAEYAHMPAKKAEEIIALVRNLDKVDNIRSFTGLLATGR
jgi:2-methylcitrate dehydratase PrpD